MEQRFITMGEIMLRLTPPNYEKIRMTHSFEASYGGAEANTALALANLGIDSTFFTVVPDNSIGKSAIRMLRSNDVHRLFCRHRMRLRHTDSEATIWRQALESDQAR